MNRLTVQRIKKMPIKNLTAKTKGVASLRKTLEDVVNPVVDRRPHDVAGLVAADSQDWASMDQLENLGKQDSNLIINMDLKDKDRRDSAVKKALKDHQDSVVSTDLMVKTPW